MAPVPAVHVHVPHHVRRYRIQHRPVLAQNPVHVHAVLPMGHVRTVAQHVRIQIHVMVIIPVRVVRPRVPHVRAVPVGRVQPQVHVQAVQSA